MVNGWKCFRNKVYSHSTLRLLRLVLFQKKTASVARFRCNFRYSKRIHHSVSSSCFWKQVTTHVRSKNRMNSDEPKAQCYWKISKENTRMETELSVCLKIMPSAGAMNISWLRNIDRIDLCNMLSMQSGMVWDNPSRQMIIQWEDGEDLRDGEAAAAASK